MTPLPYPARRSPQPTPLSAAPAARPTRRQRRLGRGLAAVTLAWTCALSTCAQASMPEPAPERLAPLTGGSKDVTVTRLDVSVGAQHIGRSDRPVRLVETYTLSASKPVPLVLAGGGLVDAAELDQAPAEVSDAGVTVTVPAGVHTLRVARWVAGWTVNGRALGDGYLRSACDLDTAPLASWGDVQRATVRVHFPALWWSAPAADERGLWRTQLQAPRTPTVLTLRTQPALPYGALLALRAAVWLLFGAALWLSARLLRRRLSGLARGLLGLGWSAAAPVCLVAESVGLGWWLFGGPNLTHFGYWTVPVFAGLALLAAVATGLLWAVATRPPRQDGQPAPSPAPTPAAPRAALVLCACVAAAAALPSPAASARPPVAKVCPAGQRVPGLPKSIAGCEEPAECGRFQARVGRTPYCPVVVRWECGDSCTIEHGLWHATQRRFVDLGGLFATLDAAKGTLVKHGKLERASEAAFSPSGRRLLVRGAVLSDTGKTVHAGFGGARGGWLTRLAVHGAR